MSGLTTDGVVQILGPHGQPVGAGFVVSAAGLVVTCAHVVEGCESQRDGSPADAVTVVFHATGEARQARVEPGYRRGDDDVAFLRVDAPLPGGVEPLILGPSVGTRGHSFQTFGYPRNGPPSGMHGYGTIGDMVAHGDGGLLQVTGAVEVALGFSGGPVFDEATERVIGMVTAITPPDTYGRGVSTAFVTPVEALRAACPELELSEVCPYRSLRAFTEADEVFFHGRDRAVDTVLAGLERDHRFLAVLGPSGSGKTSLVQAGVLPRLSRGVLAGSDRWGVIVTRPADNPLEQLERSGLVGAGKDLGRAVARWQGAHDGQRLVLVVDQLEELLVSVTITKRTGFPRQLVAAVEDSQPLTVVLVMRDDFYAPLAESAPELMPWVERNLVNVPADLQAHELAAMVERPASTVMLRLEASLADRIVADAIDAARAGGRGRGARSTVLPLLEFALTALWERRDDGGLTHQAYDQIGGVTGGLSQWCDRALEGLDAGLHPVARRVVTALVRVGDEAEGIPDSRRRRTVAELSASEDGDGTVGEVVRGLTAARLLVTSRREAGGQASVELIHEALLREWSLLRQWLAEDRDFLAWRQTIERLVAGWTDRSSGEGDPDLLLRGRQLAEAEEWLDRRGPELPADLVGFIQASKDLQRGERDRDRRRIRTLTSLTAGLIVLFLIAIIAGVVTNVQADRAREAARIAKSRELAALATAGLDAQPALSWLLSLEALRTAVTGEARASLFAGLSQPRDFIRLTGHAGSVWGVAFSPDGSRLASASSDGTVRLWDTTSGESAGKSLAGPYSAYGVAFSPDGSRLASASGEGTVRLWDTATRQPVGEPLTGHTDTVSGVAFSPDGTTIASASEDGTVRLWDTATRQPVGEPLTGYPGRIVGVAFSPDGTTIASASEDGTVRLWDTATRQPVGEPLTGYPGRIVGVVFSPDGATIASASGDGTVRLWDTATRQPVGEPLTGHSGAVYGVAFSPDGARIASAGTDGTVRLWDTATSRPLGEPLTGHTDDVVGVVFSPDGSRLASASGDGTVRLWDTATRQPLGEPLTGHTGLVWEVAFSPDGVTIASAGEDGTVRLWNAASSEPAGKQLTGHTGRVLGVTFNPDGNRLASVGEDGTVRLWDPASGQPLGKPLTGHTYAVFGVAFSPEGATIASVGIDGTMRLWDAAGGRPLGRPLTGHTGMVRGVAFSPDGSRLASAGVDGTVRLWPLRLDAWIRLTCERAGRNLSQDEWHAFVGEGTPYVRNCSEFPSGTGAPDDARAADYRLIGTELGLAS